MSEAPLLSVDTLSVAFRQDAGGPPRRVVDGVSFTINAGETVALVGESGSGKSATALSILRLLPYPVASHPSGRIVFQGRDTLTLDEPDLRALRGNRIAMVFQEPMVALNPLHAVEKQIAEVLMEHRGLSRAEAAPEVIRLLERVGLPMIAARPGALPHELSGGQRQRVVIAMALANKPDLLIADEPTTALDVTVQAQILALLKDLQQETGMAVLLITHDLGVVGHMADRICVMKDGALIEQGDVDQVLDRPSHAYTRTLIDAEPQPKASKPPQGAAGNQGPAVLEGESLSVRFPVKKGFFGQSKSEVRAVDGVSVSLMPGETVAVVGESGSGKTTLALALLRLLKSQGAIRFQGQPIEGLSGRAMRPLRRDMQIVFQDPFGALNPRLSVERIIGEGLSIHGMARDPATRRRMIETTLDDVGLPADAAERYPHEFSGGQRQRIAIARAMILKPRVVILDEPTSALDRSVQGQIIDLLLDLQKAHGLAYLFISHDLKVVRAMADRVLVMKEGQVVEEGSGEAIFTQPRTDYTKALMSAAFALRTQHDEG